MHVHDRISSSQSKTTGTIQMTIDSHLNRAWFLWREKYVRGMCFRKNCSLQTHCTAIACLLCILSVTEHCLGERTRKSDLTSSSIISMLYCCQSKTQPVYAVLYHQDAFLFPKRLSDLCMNENNSTEGQISHTSRQELPNICEATLV